MARHRKKRRHVYATHRRTKRGYRVTYRKRKFSRKTISARLARLRSYYKRKHIGGKKRRKGKKRAWGPSNPLWRWQKRHGII